MIFVGLNIVTCLLQSRYCTLGYKSTKQRQTQTVEADEEEERNNQTHAH